MKEIELAKPKIITIVTSFATPYSTEQTSEKRVVYGEEGILTERKRWQAALDKEKKRADELQKDKEFEFNHGYFAGARWLSYLIDEEGNKKKAIARFNKEEKAQFTCRSCELAKKAEAKLKELTKNHRFALKQLLKEQQTIKRTADELAEFSRKVFDDLEEYYLEDYLNDVIKIEKELRDAP